MEKALPYRSTGDQVLEAPLTHAPRYGAQRMGRRVVYHGFGPAHGQQITGTKLIFSNGAASAGDVRKNRYYREAAHLDINETRLISSSGDQPGEK